MSVVKANTYQDATGGSNAVFSGVSSPPNSMGFRNRVINGAQIVDQRGSASAAVTVNSVTKAYATDRFCGTGVGSAGVFTLGQVTTAPAGFINSLKATVTTADASLAATDLYRVMHLIEGLNCADLGWGAAGAQSVTLSFYVYSNLTGTFGGALINSAANYSYPFSYTISAANTWEQKTVTIAGPTSGTWLTTNGIGISINWGLGVGSTYSGTAGSWSANEYYSATGATNVMATNGNTFFITGVQLEAGTNASAFERRDYGRELMMCQRYLPALGGAATGSYYCMGYSQTSTQANLFYPFKVTPRVAPTGITIVNVGSFGATTQQSGSAGSSGSFTNASLEGCNFFLNTSASYNVSWPLYLYSNGTNGQILFTGCEL